MKALHIQINITNDEKFQCNVKTDLLEREDCNDFERMMAKEFEDIINKYVEMLADSMKAKLDRK